jgi:micrococcal nuclease
MRNLLALGLVSVTLLMGCAAVPTAPTSPVKTSELVCHVYTEPKNAVAVKAVVPVRKDLTGPLYKVTEVIDGDTIKIVKDGKSVNVRFLAMDTPEKSSTRFGHPEYYGIEATKHANELITASGKEVRLTYESVTVDKYGRTLAYIWLKDGRMLNAVLVADGYAYAYTVGKKPEYADAMLALMRQARTESKGLWRTCH